MNYTDRPISPDKKKELMGLETEYKEIISYGKIEEWYTAWGGKCYVSFSGGKESTTLAYLVAKWLSSFREPPYPLTLVFVNTGLEYPEIQRFVNEYADWLRQKFPRIKVNLVRLRPKMNIRQVLAKYGYPVVGKEISAYVENARINPTGGAMKRMKRHEHETGAKPMTALMAEESRLRMLKWMKTGCNAFDGSHPMSKPMSFWTEQDVLRYLRENDIPICPVYGEIVASDGENDYASTLCDAKLRCTGCQRTGCMFCAFGAHLEKGENRFERMKRTHPKHYAFCIGGGEFDPASGLWVPNEKGLGFARVLDYIGVRY